MSNTKELIIATTIKLIKNAGSDPTQITIRDISREAGIAVSQINYHFASKENLIAVCVQSMIQDVIALFGATLRQADKLSPFETLRYMANLTFGFLYENENLSRISILTDYQSGESGDNTSLTMQAYFPLIEAVCAERNIQDPQRVTQMLVLTLQGAFLRSEVVKEELHMDLRNPPERAAFVDSVLKQYLK